MLGRVRRWLDRLFGREAKQQQREIVELARQANVYPDNERLILRLGDCYLRSGDKERALSAYWHVVDLYKKRQDWTKTVAVLRRIVMLAPGELIARFELAHCFEKLERRREAAEQWEIAARALEYKGDVDGAIRSFSRALALDPLASHLARELDRLRPPIPKLAPLPKPVAPIVEPQPVAAPPPVQPKVKPNLASLGRAQVREELMQATMLDNPLDGYDLGVQGKTTTEYSAEDLGTLLADDFAAETIAVETLPAFDEEHRPGDTPSEPIVIS